MLISAAIVPGPPAFVAELMGSAARELDDLRHAADGVVAETVSVLVAAVAQTIADLVATEADSSSAQSVGAQLVVVGPGHPGVHEARGPVSFAGFGRDVTVPTLVDGQRLVRDLPTPLMVARYLASRDLAAHPDHGQLWATASWVTTDESDATALGEKLREDGTLVALILVADGATCHGPKAPRAEDSRAPAYEDAVCAALESGKPSRLAQVDVELGRELGATGPQLWPVLAAAADGHGIGELRWRGAPYGVGWAVASWRRSTTWTSSDDED
jgi:hypothetical protein